jgi:hypothetical protein
VLYIDDEIEVITTDQIEFMKMYIHDKGHSENFQLMFKDKQDLMGVIHEILEGNYSRFEEDETIQLDLREMLLSENLELAQHLVSPADQLFYKIKNIFEPLTVEAFNSYSGVDVKEYQLIILDYDFRDQFTALDIINTLKLDENELYYIILLSSHDEFSYKTRDYNMLNPEIRQDLFRKYSSDNKLQFQALLNYINKSNSRSNESFAKEILNTLEEFNAGTIMVDVITNVKDLLNNGVEEAARKLLLTNTKTMQALINDKLENEGVSESTYLVDFSLTLVKNIVNESIPIMESVHNQMKRLQEWKSEIVDYETDDHMRVLREIQLFDTKVNDRYSPIDFGDIFEFDMDGKTVRGLLVTQSCDLVIRKGKIGYGRKDPLATIILEVPQATNDGCYEMRIGRHDYVWDVRKVIIMPSEILDVTTFNDNGKAVFFKDYQAPNTFSWSSAYSAYVRKITQDFNSMLIDETVPVERIFKYNRMAFVMWASNQSIDFKITRKGRLDFFETSSVLKLHSDVKTRVPLMMDPSNSSYKDLRVLVNSKESRIKFYSQVDGNKIRIYLDGNNIRQKLESEEMYVTGRIGEKIESYFLSYGFYIYSEQLETRLIEINSNTINELKKIGLQVNINKDFVNLEYIYMSKLEFMGKECTYNVDYLVYPSNTSDIPKILLRKELVDRLPDGDDIVVRMGGEQEYVNATHPLFCPQFTLDGNVGKLIVQPKIRRTARNA